MNYINLHTHILSDDDNVFSILNNYPNSSNFNIPFSIGIHPWYIKEENLNEEYQKVEEKLQNKKCYAIGECGLDKTIKVDFNLQLTVFKRQIILSEKYKKPIIIHCVKSFQEVIKLKEEFQPKQSWIIHGFNKKTQLAKDLVNKGFLLSLGTSVLKSEKLHQTILEIPISNYFLETDASKENIKEIYSKFALIKKVDLNSIINQMHKNFNRVFKR